MDLAGIFFQQLQSPRSHHLCGWGLTVSLTTRGPFLWPGHSALSPPSKSPSASGVSLSLPKRCEETGSSGDPEAAHSEVPVTTPLSNMLHFISAISSLTA